MFPVRRPFPAQTMFPVNRMQLCKLCSWSDPAPPCCPSQLVYWWAQVCLFSYGQTGAGKTHTMQGTKSGEGRGIIPRAILKVLALAVCAHRAHLKILTPAVCAHIKWQCNGSAHAKNCAAFAKISLHVVNRCQWPLASADADIHKCVTDVSVYHLNQVCTNAQEYNLSRLLQHHEAMLKLPARMCMTAHA